MLFRSRLEERVHVVLRIKIGAARTRQHDGCGDSHRQADRHAGEWRSGTLAKQDGRMMSQNDIPVND